MKKSIKMISMFVLVLSLIAPLALSAGAVNSHLDVTVTRDMRGEDCYSYKTVKDGGSNWDNNFYVTNRTFYGSGRISFMSFYANNYNLHSNSITHSDRTKGATYSSSYKFNTRTYAGQKFYAAALHMSSSQDYRLRLIGTYCP